jgi:glycosyltransferase involved in cell wall biosynthesis
MHYGTPVVAAATTSVPEVCRDAALYFNPLDVEELKNRLLMLHIEPTLYYRLKEKGHVRAQQLMSAQPQALNEILERVLR